jgi:AraC-like DNA-binding protein
MLFTNYDCPQAQRDEKFYLEYSCIIYVISGKRIFHKQNQSWELTEGTCVFVKEGTHVATKNENDGWCVMAFFIPKHFLTQLISDHRKTLSISRLPEGGLEHVLPLDVNDLSKSFFFSMLPYFTHPTPPAENLLELKFKELVLSLLANSRNEHFLSYLMRLSNDWHPSMEEIMLDNFTFNLTMADYARLACKSVPTFKRDFKKVFNDTPASWVMKKRLALATDLLQNSRMSISQITFECGFENQTHFSRVFKEKVGIPPSQFRSAPNRGI